MSTGVLQEYPIPDVICSKLAPNVRVSFSPTGSHISFLTSPRAHFVSILTVNPSEKNDVRYFGNLFDNYALHSYPDWSTRRIGSGSVDGPVAGETTDGIVGIGRSWERLYSFTYLRTSDRPYNLLDIWCLSTNELISSFPVSTNHLPTFYACGISDYEDRLVTYSGNKIYVYSIADL
jgi:hypothetical protein